MAHGNLRMTYRFEKWWSFIANSVKLPEAYSLANEMRLIHWGLNQIGWLAAE